MPIENNSADNLQLIVPNLHRRYSGVTATNRMVAPKLAKMFRAAWLGPDAPDGIARIGRRRSAEIVAPPHAADLACAAQQRDDRGRAAARARLAAETGVHLGGAAASHLDHALADPADGRDHRHQRHLGVVPQGARPPSLCMASIPMPMRRRRSRRGLRGSRIAGPLRDRLLRPGARAKGQRRVRRRDVPAAATLSGFHRGDGRRHHAGAAALCGWFEEADRGRRTAVAHRHHGRTCRSRRCSAGTSG